MLVSLIAAQPYSMHRTMMNIRKETRDQKHLCTHPSSYLLWSLSWNLLCRAQFEVISLKTMEDGQVLLYSNSVNARESEIPYPWLCCSYLAEASHKETWMAT
ncbi:hypothetical protein LWI29_005867 [Acer saccharum]|uniref:Uncharacterized protein n=1 Tax=Acer saccharum TaxID=4024 RepID=A0AA39RGL5_ACESA|nr:hypothetical protein LWI29_005867 [Acer saccharum]